MFGIKSFSFLLLLVILSGCASTPAPHYDYCKGGAIFCPHFADREVSK